MKSSGAFLGNSSKTFLNDDESNPVLLVPYGDLRFSYVQGVRQVCGVWKGECFNRGSQVVASLLVCHRGRVDHNFMHSESTSLFCQKQSDFGKGERVSPLGL